MKLLHTSLIAALLFAQVGCQKSEHRIKVRMVEIGSENGASQEISLGEIGLRLTPNPKHSDPGFNNVDLTGKEIIAILIQDRNGIPVDMTIYYQNRVCNEEKGMVISPGGSLTIPMYYPLDTTGWLTREQAQKKSKPYISPAEPFEYRAGDARIPVPVPTFLYSGGVGKDGRMWPLEKLLDEKMEPILKAIQEHNSPIGTTAPSAYCYCEHEWEDRGDVLWKWVTGETVAGLWRASREGFPMEQCKKCGLLRIKP